MSNQTTAKYQTDQDSTKCSIPFFVEEYNLCIPEISGTKILELGQIFHFEIPEVKKKLKGWGLFKGLKVGEKDIEEAKKSLFPDREF